jgi:hypothetical protein
MSRKHISAPRRRKLDGVDFVRCRICRAHLRVISGRHLLSKHGITRETYMREYGLTPDELIATDSRVLHSSRRDFVPHSRREWIAAVKQLYNREQLTGKDGVTLAARCQGTMRRVPAEAFSFSSPYSIVT